MKTRPGIQTRPGRVLVVDDERQNRRLLEVMLAAEKLNVVAAESGEEALVKITEDPPDLVLLDVMMPGMNGYQVAAALKSDLATQNIPIIMVTALADRHARLLGLDSGAEEFLSKPVDRAELCVRVRNLLQLKAYGDYYDQYSRQLEDEVCARTAELLDRTKVLESQSIVLSEQAALLQLAHDAIVVRDMQDRIVFWNRAAEVIYGWTNGEALGRNVFDLLKAEWADPEEDPAAFLLGTGKWEGEIAYTRRDGSRAYVNSRWALQRDAHGAPIRCLAIDTDITDRKRTLAELLALTERERTRQEQLRFKDEFLSHVSHELRSPLTAIKQFTSILLNGLAGDVNEKQQEYQRIILKNVRQLQVMIDDLLEVTRLETGKFTLNLQHVAVADAVRDACETLQVTARTKGVTLSGDVPANLPGAHADPARLRQILIILLDNAVKFTDRGGSVEVKAKILPDDLLLVQVTDTGCGVRADQVERIFERLYQEQSATRASRKGLGLGLHICRELVTRLGGRIWVERAAGKGSTFSFTMPVHAPHVEEATTDAEKMTA